MKKRIESGLVLGTAALLLACGGAPEATTELAGQEQVADTVTPAPRLAEGFAFLFYPYEEVRMALVEDRAADVAAPATRLAAAARTLQADVSVESAGVEEGATEDLVALLPGLSEQAESLAAMDDLEGLRRAFAGLSEMMLAYREMLVGEAPLVAYCPMVEKSWLQSGEEIGNPYYGSAMSRCGEIRSPAVGGGGS